MTDPGPGADTSDAVLDDTIPASGAVQAGGGAPVSGTVARSSAQSSGWPRVPLSLQARYEDIRLLGEGGVGVVYRAHDPRLRREVALKLLKYGDPVRHRRLLKEARAQARVHHENVCRVYDAGEADGEPFIVMQFVEGGPLGKLQAQLSLDEKVQILRTVSAAMHAAHRQGLVHRDLKPGNILVEGEPGGALKPYVVDFGLVREVDSGSETQGGGGAGTPAYMAPEQVAGGAIDARTDVYGLGATLYEMISGRAPYVGDVPWKILAQVASREPTPLRELVSQVPPALEAITMTCLARDPAQRYGSARALSEDLQRFLDGEEVGARQVSSVRRVWRGLRQHNASWVGALVGMLGLAALAGAWWVRRGGEVDAQLAQELGREAAGMELLMRSAYQMPLHDVDRERAMVRERLAGLEARLAEAREARGARGATLGPLHYAIGRGRLSLGDLVAAEEHLTAARDADYAPAELGYALGMTLLKLHLRLRSAAEHIGDEAERKARYAALDARYKEPGLALLRTAPPAQLEPPEYAEALLALHEERFEEARVKAVEAFTRSPLLFEAKWLEGDALASLALLDWTGGRPGWWPTMSARMEQARAAFEAAEDVARSSPEVLRSLCALETRAMFAARFQGESSEPAFARGREVCARAVRADGSSSEARVARANLHALYVYGRVDALPREAPRQEVREAVQFAEEAVAARPEDVEAWKTLGTALRAEIALGMYEGRDVGPAVRRATAVYEEAIAKFPRHGAAYESLATVLGMEATLSGARGEAVQPAVERAMRLLDDGLSRSASVAMTHHKRAALLLQEARALLDAGASPEALVGRAFEELRAARGLSGAWFGLTEVEAEGHLVLARHALASGGDPRGALARVMEGARELGEGAQGRTAGYALEGEAALVEAEFQGRQGRDPGEALARGRQRFAQAAEAAPWVMAFALGQARVELRAAAWAMGRRRSAAAALAEARARIEPWVTEERASAEPFALLAEGCALGLEGGNAGAGGAVRGEEAEALLGRGLGLVAQALARNPRQASALAVKGRLLLAKARLASEAEALAEARVEARGALAEAIRQNPLLERALGEALAEARGERGEARGERGIARMGDSGRFEAIAT
ncbi:Hypothetical protein CAP_4540 [Chondromyces apiculatus DSM 436]|uniref:Protein kinase domain-containing protein n=1 Tax=Chondromyces apiculatus DSM 436 TaxID=1192034 RepID=A0A017T727_9BACT|nr:Hypothetical protein CAP_4540 [Chondromyces apiculatus DSM 436]